jgi:hypothetical protein
MRAAKKAGKQSRRKSVGAPPRQTDDSGVLEDIQLREELERANQLPRSTPGQRRLAMMITLSAVCGYLEGRVEMSGPQLLHVLQRRGIPLSAEAAAGVRALPASGGIPGKSVTLLYELVRELFSVERGTPSEVFTPPKLPHRPPASLQKEFRAATAAAAVDVLVRRAGRTVHEAEREVAAVCREAGRSDLTQKTIQSYRHRFSRKRSARMGAMVYGDVRERYLAVFAEFHAREEMVFALKQSLVEDLS